MELYRRLGLNMNFVRLVRPVRVKLAPTSMRNISLSSYFKKDKQTLVKHSNTAPLILGYWKMRGLAQPIRLLLGYTETEFIDVIYEMGDAPDYDMSCWLNVKETLGLDYPNLPYLIDGDIQITQSNACLRYIGRKHNLDGITEQEKVHVDIMENVAVDFKKSFSKLCYGPMPDNIEEKKKNFSDEVRETFFKRFEADLRGKDFFAGKNLTYVDFPMWEIIQLHLLVVPDILNGFPNLQAFCKRFERIPKIAEFLKSDKCFKGPMNNKTAWLE